MPEDFVKKDGSYWLSARGVLRIVELTDPDDIKPGAKRDWILDFQKRRPFMNEAQAMREVLEQIGCGEMMPKPREVKP